MRKILRTLALATSLCTTAFGVSAAPINQLGFILDASGSVLESDYDLLRTGLNSALAGLPTDGSVEITVVSYSTSAFAVVAPTVLTSATLPVVQASISNHVKSGGTTDTGEAIELTTALLTGSINFSDPGSRSAINLATDGVPNSQSVAQQAALAAAAAGIGSLSIEAIGTAVNSGSQLNNNLALAFPGPATILPLDSTNITDPAGGSFVVPLTDFTTYAAVVNAKVNAIVTNPNPNPNPNPVPEPGMLAMLALGAFGMVAIRRRTATF